MKLRSLVLLAAASLLLFTACKNSKSPDLLVPKEALMAIHINLESLSSKLSWDEVSKTNWFQDIAKEASTDSVAKQLLAQPAQSGVNTSKSQTFFIASSKPRSFYTGFEGSLKDAAAFEKFLHQVDKEQKASFTKEGDLNLAFSNEDVVIAWNNSKFLMLGNFGADKYGIPGNDAIYSSGNPLTVDSLKQIAVNLFKRKGDALLGSDKRFAELVTDGGDLHWWGNYVSTIFNEYSGGMLSMMKVNLLVENTATAATISFDNGKITARSRQYVGKEVTNLFKEYEPKPISEATLSRLPASEVLAAGAFSYKPEGLKALLQLIGMDGMVNGFLGRAGYSVDEFIKANKGEILFAISDFDLKRDSTAYEDFDGKKSYIYRNEPKINFVAGTSVNDKEAFNKLIGILLKETDKIDQAKPNVSYKLGDSWFATGTSTGEVDAFLAGGSKPAYASKIAGHHAGFYLNFNRLFSIMQTIKEYEKADAASERWQSEKAMLDASASFWDEVVANGDVKNGVLTSYAEVVLKDKNTNSLVQLNKYLDKMYTLRPKEKAWDMSDAELTPIPAPVDSAR